MRSIRHLRDDSGQVLIVVALCMVVLMAFVGIAVDVGSLRYEKRKLQLAADAAALAASLEVKGTVNDAAFVPKGGTLVTRYGLAKVVVSLIDLSGSADGSWSEGTIAGTCRKATVSALLPHPELWRAGAAVLGRDGGRFTQLPAEVAEHREGRALRVEVPIADGWSVLRLEKRED